ncbi:plasmid mobilization relaxosome protein MobC, partial [Escherichia coli]|uniref:plasmid mobilization relaxosome protein MobC n=1 Tax=Escherichia coli TaxID=562 RepID=UPI0028E046B2
GGEGGGGGGRGGLGGGGGARRGKLPTLAPPLLGHLAASGTNLNQTARKVDSGQWSSIDRVHVVAALMATEGELRQLRQAVGEQGVRDDS